MCVGGVCIETITPNTSTAFEPYNSLSGSNCTDRTATSTTALRMSSHLHTNFSIISHLFCVRMCVTRVCACVLHSVCSCLVSGVFAFSCVAAGWPGCCFLRAVCLPVSGCLCLCTSSSNAVKKNAIHTQTLIADTTQPQTLIRQSGNVEHKQHDQTRPTHTHTQFNQLLYQQNSNR